VTVDEIDAAADQPVREADLFRADGIPQLGPQWTETTATSPGPFAARARPMTPSAVASDRSGSKSTPGRPGAAAQPGGIPLEAVPQEKITTRPPPGTGTAAGRRA
jgi:hypothetical protein